MRTRRPGSGNGSGRSSVADAIALTAAIAPTTSVTVISRAAASPGRRMSARKEDVRWPRVMEPDPFLRSDGSVWNSGGEMARSPEPQIQKTTSPPFLPAVELEATSAVPLYEQLYLELRRQILAGRLRRGARLASTRDLARHLAVSRFTVV